MIRTLGVTTPQTVGGTTWSFQSWSDGGAATHEFTVPTASATFTANFTSAGGAPIANGVYRMFPTHVAAGTRCADISGRSTASGGDLIQWSCNGQTNQQFSFTHLGSGVYEIHAVHSNLCLGVSGNSGASGADVLQLTCNAAAGQRWLVRPVAGQADTFELLAQSGTNQCLSVSGSSTTAGADIVQSTCAGGANQRFRITP